MISAIKFTEGETTMDIMSLGEMKKLSDSIMSCFQTGKMRFLSSKSVLSLIKRYCVYYIMSCDLNVNKDGNKP